MDLSHLALPGATLAVRATPGAASEGITRDGGVIRIRVTNVAEGGKANVAIARVLARALGVAKGRLTLVRGATSRDKLFRLD